MFQGAAEDPQTALALNLDPALMKKSDAEGPRLLLPETELSIRIGRAGLLAGKLPAAGPGLGTGGRRNGRGRVGSSVLCLRTPFPAVCRAELVSGAGPPLSFVLQTPCLVPRR